MPTIKRRPPIQDRSIHLGPLSVGDVTAIVFATVETSSKAFFSAANKSTLKRELPGNPPINGFTRMLHSVVLQRKGSLYAAIVTSIDADNLFHPKRFAVAMKRLGVVDEIEAYFNSMGMTEVSSKLANAIPWFWADAALLQISMVKRNISSSVTEAICSIPGMSTPDMGQLIEQEVLNLPVTSGIAGIAYGASNFSPASSGQVYNSYFRNMAQSRGIGILDKSSSLPAIFENFRQHVLSNPTALQRLLPTVKYGNQEFKGRELQALFRSKTVVDKIQRSFMLAYDKYAHSINLTKLYNAMYTGGVDKAIRASLKTNSKKRVTKQVVSGIIASVIGLFFAFTGDTRGQNLPVMTTIKREAK